ncbi:MAG: glycosyltransferase [Geoalkalibacter sp.]|uniref:glycosyltransferase n=1 Tax=Geoalkalibacter sp. TaxID=3041440 RepID=UPI003D123A6C
MLKKIAVIIINYNGWRHTLNCLDSIANSAKNKDFIKIFLVDNNSSDDSRTQIRSYLSTKNTLSVDFILSDENRGFSAGNNLGVEKALNEDFDAIMLLNNDTIIERNIFAIALQFFDEYPDCMVIAGNTKRLDGSRELTCTRAKPSFGNMLFLYHTPFWNKPWFPGFKRHYMLDQDFTRPFPVYAGSGACLVFRRDFFEKAGLFDEHTFLFAEELIIGEICARLGFKSYSVPRVTVIHLSGQSTKTVKALSFIEFCRSEKYLVRTYYGYGLFTLAPMFLLRSAKYLYYCSSKADFRKNFRRFIKVYNCLRPSSR